MSSDPSLSLCCRPPQRNLADTRRARRVGGTPYPVALQQHHDFLEGLKRTDYRFCPTAAGRSGSRLRTPVCASAISTLYSSSVLPRIWSMALRDLMYWLLASISASARAVESRCTITTLRIVDVPSSYLRFSPFRVCSCSLRDCTALS